MLLEKLLITVSLIWLEIVLIFCEADITFQFFCSAISLKPSFTVSKNLIPYDSILSGISFFLLNILSSGEISKKKVRSGDSPWQTIDSIFLIISKFIFLP